MTRKIGRYEVKSELGRGGMATVYRAYDPRFERNVAIKVLPKEFLHDPMFRERFEREAKTIANLEHSAIVPVYDYGEYDEQLYLVMRYMTGGSLHDRIKEGPLPLDEAAKITERLAAALDMAHNEEIVHRDLKPANILFDRNGDAYLSDFGIVKLAQASMSLTGTGTIGTPSYMSPEQARGDSDIDGRSDIYALGVILFEMVTGQAPYQADTPMGVAIKHILDPVPDILSIKPDLPEDMGTVINITMAKDRRGRYKTASDLAASMTAIAHDEPLPTLVTEGPVLPPSREPPIDDSGQHPAVKALKALSAEPEGIARAQVETPDGAAAFPKTGAPLTARLSPEQREKLTTALPFIEEVWGDRRLVLIIAIAFAAIFMLNAVFRAVGQAPEMHPKLCWPNIILVPGLAMLLAGLRGPKKVAGMAVPGTIVTMVGILLFYQNLFDHWETWAYAWTLIPAAAGIGIMLFATRIDSEFLLKTGRRTASIGVILLLVFGTFFEFILRISHNILCATVWPVLLIALGAYWLMRARPSDPEPAGEPAR
jgi:serine/threonine protein kinase